MKNPKLPLPESYWVEPGRLLAGEYPGNYGVERTRQRIDALLEAGIDTFIDLTKPNEIIPYENILLEQAKAYDVNAKRYNFPINDMGLPTPELMNTILETLDREIQKGHRIYLHCWGGIGRTGTTVGCYLVHRGGTGKEALDQLAEWWRSVPKSQYHPHSPETHAQAEFVRAWAEHDKK